MVGIEKNINRKKGIAVKTLKIGFIIVLAMTLSSLTVLAEKTTDKDTGLGEKLLRQIWENMKNTDMKAIDTVLADGYQSVHEDGASDRAHEISLIKNLKMGDYTLTKIKITRTGPVIVATYFVSVTETIEGERLTKTPAARLSVFVETEKGWKWVAHANLKPLQ